MIYARLGVPRTPQPLVRLKELSRRIDYFVVKCCYVDCEGSFYDLEDGVQDRK